MTTALAFIESAMSKIGMLAAGETVSAEDADVCLARLNSMLDAWENEGLYGYATTDTVFNLPASTTSRTIGPAQQISMTRPVKILEGSFSRVDGIDYPLTSVNEAVYNSVGLKSQISSVAPSICFYDGGTPTGNVYFWPIATAAAEVHLITPTAKTTAAATTTDMVFPPGYDRAIEYCLAIEIAPDFNTPVSPLVAMQAATARRLIKRSNHRVPQLDIPRVGDEYYRADIGGWPYT